MNHQLPNPFIFRFKFISALYRLRMLWQWEIKNMTHSPRFQIKFFEKCLLVFFLPDNLHHMTEERHFNWLFFSRNAQFTLFLCSKWPAPDLKRLIITIITHIVQQSPSRSLVVQFFSTAGRQQRASMIFKHRVKKGKTNLIAISRYWIQERRQTFEIIMVHMLCDRLSILFLRVKRGS